MICKLYLDKLFFKRTFADSVGNLRARDFDYVLLCPGCYDKILQTGWPGEQEFISPGFKRWNSKIEVLADLVSSEFFFFSLLDAVFFSLCLHVLCLWESCPLPVRILIILGEGTPKRPYFNLFPSSGCCCGTVG